MNAARDHSRFDELAVGSALYALEPGDEQALAEHLPTCARCQQTQRDSLESLAIVAASLDGPMPPAHVLDRIHEAIGSPTTTQPEPEPELPTVADQPPLVVDGPTEAAAPVQADDRADGLDREHTVAAGPAARSTDLVEDHTRPQSAAGPQGKHRQGPGRGSRRVSRLRRLSEVAGAFVLVVAVAIGVTGYNHMRNQNDRANQVAAERSATIQQLVRDSSVATLADSTTGKPVAHVVNQNGKLEVVNDGLSVNDRQNSEYALWAIYGPRGPKLVGTFDVRQGDLGVQSVASVPAGFHNVTAMAVSKEPGRGRPTSPTTIKAMGAVTS